MFTIDIFAAIFIGLWCLGVYLVIRNDKEFYKNNHK